VLIDDETLAGPIEERLDELGVRRPDADADADADATVPTFAVKGRADSGQPLLVLDQQGHTLSRARGAEEIVAAVIELITGFTDFTAGPRLAGRIVGRPDGTVSVVEAMPGRTLAALTPRLTKAGFDVRSPIEFEIDEHGQVIDADGTPRAVRSMLLLASDIAADHGPYLAAARLGHALIAEIGVDDRAEALRRIALLAESLERVVPIASLDANLILPALTES